AEVAARNARAVAAAQRELLEEIEQWNQPAAESRTNPAEPLGELFEELPLLEIVETREAAAAGSVAESSRARRRTQEERGVDFAAPAFTAAAPFTSAQLQVRLHEQVELAPPTETFYVPSRKVAVASEELAELDEEIEFRMAPEFADLVLETQAIPGNIIEFPRELVAPRKARPRLAEGPLRADGTPEPQLRIFEVELAEVEPAQISAEAEATALADAPEWQGMMLGAGPAADSRTRISAQLEAQLHLDQPLYVATVARRAYSAAVDLLCVSAGFAGYLAAALKIGGAGLLALQRPLLGGVLAGSFVVFALMYQLLFFTLNDATPGMRVARVAFCTFSERSPSRRAVRRRLVSTVLAMCPLGLGLVWMLLDGDGLGWHDRMSRMYPREY
ncbi:MAG: RDD family protein, partial [Acidobacteriaceae bacterium]